MSRQAAVAAAANVHLFLAEWFMLLQVSPKDMVVNPHALTEDESPAAGYRHPAAGVSLHSVISACASYAGNQTNKINDGAEATVQSHAGSTADADADSGAEEKDIGNKEKGADIKTLERASFAQLVQTLYQSVTALKTGRTPLNLGTCLAEMFLLRSQLTYVT